VLLTFGPLIGGGPKSRIAIPLGLALVHTAGCRGEALAAEWRSCRGAGWSAW